MSRSKTPNNMNQISEEANQLADFVMMTQRSCILNLSAELNEGKVSYPQFFLLTYLDNEDFLTMSCIAKKMGHTTAAATGMVDKLQEMGYVTRHAAATDRRKIMVAITEEGKALISKMRQNIAQDLAKMMAGNDSTQNNSIESTQKALRQRLLDL